MTLLESALQTPAEWHAQVDAILRARNEEVDRAGPSPEDRLRARVDNLFDVKGAFVLFECARKARLAVDVLAIQHRGVYELTCFYHGVPTNFRFGGAGRKSIDVNPL